MATKSIAWNTGSGNITLTYQGQGDGTIVVESDENELGNSRSQIITVETLDGVVSRNLTVSQAACPFPVGEIKNYSYTGSYQEVELPAGLYKLQCWGAQGGSNGANSSYGITAQAGGKGGYSEGILTLSQKTTVRVYVGGQGSASAEGFNGGGSTTGTSQYDASNEFGYSKMGGGGGATDIRLSDGNLLSRMIVAGGGGGGAMCLKRTTTTQTVWQQVGTLTFNGTDYCDGSINGTPILNYWCRYDNTYYTSEVFLDGIPFNAGDVIRVTASPSCNSTGSGQGSIGVTNYYRWGIGWVDYQSFIDQQTYTIPNDGVYFRVVISKADVLYSGTLTFEIQTTEPVTTDSYSSQVGYVGGGSSGGGYSDTYKGRQSAAGTGGSFGQGANQTMTNYRYCSGAGGGGWYGGGGQQSDSTMTYCKYSGGGSGWVNVAASAGNRPSGYTGLQLDSGQTKDGSTSFPSTGGSTETGHSGNGYARITRIDPNNMEFEYTGYVQSRTLSAGTYKIECWGAQGGSYSTTYYGGKGGYSVGKLTLESNTTVYVYVGGQGTGGSSSGNKAGGFNGGGKGYSTSTTYLTGSGGGASDVRIGQDSLYARVIVAGGGGGFGSYNSTNSNRRVGGYGGGASGGSGGQYSTSYKAGTGGTQTAAGTSYYSTTSNSTTYGNLPAFGTGGASKSTSYQIAGGGGGWYGGGYAGRGGGAGGGSGYVYNADTAVNYPSGCLLNSAYYLADAETKDGGISMPSTSGSTETGHAGNGHVRITKIS